MSSRTGVTTPVASSLTYTIYLVIFEDLNIQGMTKSARDSRDKPGKNVARKRGLKRAILRSGWGRLERYMAYKTYTEKINPKYTSQRCHKLRGCT